jgi:hypothetical protein
LNARNHRRAMRQRRAPILTTSLSIDRSVPAKARGAFRRVPGITYHPPSRERTGARRCPRRAGIDALSALGMSASLILFSEIIFRN